MSRQSAARAAARLASLKSNRIKISTCPVCEHHIYANQSTTWISVDDVPSRVHQGCAPS